MKIQYVSDLHLEFRPHMYNSVIMPCADILILAGDICVCTGVDYQVFLNFLNFYKTKYIYILHVAGNHEFYSNTKKTVESMQKIIKKLKMLNKVIPNYIFLNNELIHLKIKGKTYHFAGTTLWTKIQTHNISSVEHMLNDYNFIYIDTKNGISKFRVAYMHKIHLLGIKFLKYINTLKLPIILITHHKPIKESLDDSPKNDAYEADLKHLINRPIRIAIHGHTHVKYSKLHNNVLVVSNPKGYPGQNTKFNVCSFLNL